MWPFKDKRPELTSGAYRRWLRAQRPDYVDFLKYSEDEQEALACLGDEYLIYCTELAAGVQEDPEDVARGVAQGIEDVINRSKPTPTFEPVTMSGLGARREAKEKSRATKTNGARSLLGRKPDEVVHPEKG